MPASQAGRRRFESGRPLQASWLILESVLLNDGFWLAGGHAAYHTIMTETLSTSRLARAAGVGIETIRYYERRGLIPEPDRTRSGYRRYPPATVDRVVFIRRTQKLGFTLREIGELLELRVDARKTCAEVEETIVVKIDEVADRLEDLETLRTTLERLAERCRTSPPSGSCPFLEELMRS